MHHDTDSSHAGHSVATSHAGEGPAAARMTHDRHQGHWVAMLRDKYWLSVVLTIPVVLWSREAPPSALSLWSRSEARLHDAS